MELAAEYISAESRVATQATKQWNIPRVRQPLDSQKWQLLPAKLHNLLETMRSQFSR